MEESFFLNRKSYFAAKETVSTENNWERQTEHKMLPLCKCQLGAPEQIMSSAATEKITSDHNENREIKPRHSPLFPATIRCYKPACETLTCLQTLTLLF